VKFGNVTYDWSGLVVIFDEFTTRNHKSMNRRTNAWYDAKKVEIRRQQTAGITGRCEKRDVGVYHSYASIYIYV
jgi:hypothetical protein